MTKNQENKLSMFIAVEQVTNYHSDVWTNFPAFKNQFNEFETLIQQINDTLMDQRRKTTGVTKDKKNAKNNAIRKALFVSEAVYTYASVIGNNKMADRLSFKLNDLNKGRDTVILADLRVIHEIAQQNIAELSDYDVTQVDLDELADLIEAYESVIENPRQAITNKARATKKLKAQILLADTILKNRLDRLINRYMVKNPDFWNQYKFARKIVNLGHRRRKEEAVAAEQD